MRLLFFASLSLRRSLLSVAYVELDAVAYVELDAVAYVELDVVLYFLFL